MNPEPDTAEPGKGTTGFESDSQMPCFSHSLIDSPARSNYFELSGVGVGVT
jgi:hypothetical protein